MHLVGQSSGGLYAREFASKFPQEVVGLALVDATPPESFDLIPRAREIFGLDRDCPAAIRSWLVCEETRPGSSCRG